MGKKPLIQKLIRGDPVLVNCAVQFCKQNQSIEDIEEMGQKAIVALVGGQGWSIAAFSAQWCANQKGDLLKSIC